MIKIIDCLYGQVRSLRSTINGRDHLEPASNIEIVDRFGLTWDKKTRLNPLSSEIDRHIFSYGEMFNEARPISKFVKEMTINLDYEKYIDRNKEEQVFAAFVLGKWYLIEQLCKLNQRKDFDGFYCVRQYDTWWPEVLDVLTLYKLLEQARYKPDIPFALVKNLDTTRKDDKDWKWNFPLASSMMTDAFLLNQAAIDKLAGNFFITALEEIDTIFKYFGKTHRCLTDMPGTILANVLTKNDVMMINTRAISIPEINHKWVLHTTWDRLNRVNIDLSE